MKNILLAFFLIFISFSVSKAQIADGSIAPDFTVTDINGNTHNLYTYLNAGKHVILDFSATWCGPCWNYHNTHNLETLWDQYGPSGSNEIMVFFLESENNNNLACLYGPSGCVGPNGGTQGNWVAGTGYPIVDLSSIGMNSVKTSYQISYFPTLFGINAHDKRVFEVGQKSVFGWETWLFQSFEMDTNPNVVQPLCAGTGAINLNVTGGYASKTYSWSNGATTPSLMNLNSGTYSCEITDANGYFIETENFVLTGTPAINITTVNQTNVFCGGSNTGSVQVSASGGSGGFQYSWSNGAVGSILSNVPAGTYEVTATDVIGCEKIQSYTVTEPAPISVSPYIQHATCNLPNGSVVLNSSGGTPPFTYELNGINQSSPIFDDLSGGDYPYVVIDFNNCLYTSSLTINTTATPQAVSSSTANITCLNPTGQVSGTGSSTGNGIAYLWTTTNGTIQSGANQLVATVSAGGTYTLKVTNQGNGCSSTSSVTVPGNTTAPTAQIQTPANLDCVTSTVTINAAQSSTGPNFVYNWTTQNGNIVSGANTLTPVVDASGTYQLKITNTSNGCETTANSSVAEDFAVPVVTVPAAIEITCGAPEVEICASVNSGTIHWNLPDANSNCILVNEAGVYSLTATGSNGCTTEAFTTVTLSDDLPQVQVETPNPLTCTVSETTINGTVEGNPDDFSFNWTTENGVIVSGADAQEVVVSGAGVYTLHTVNNANGCAVETSVTVEQISLAPSSAYEGTLTGSDLTATATTVAPTTSFEWKLNGEPAGNGNSVAITLTEPGSYELCLTTTNDCGSNNTCETYVILAPLALSLSANDITCFGENNGAASASIFGGVEPFTYEWTGPNGFTSDAASISGLAPGLYTLVVTDASGTSISQDIEISEPAAITVQTVNIINDTNNQNQGSVTINVVGGTDGLTYLWSNGQTTSQLTGVGAGQYTCQVSDVNSCVKTFGPYTVENASSTDESKYINSLDLYPNPASGELNLNLVLVHNHPVKVNMVNALGSFVFQQKYNGNVSDKLDVSSMSPGLYFVQIIGETFSISRKVLIVK